jgi:GNAT superfamily N-acetyltransferase
LHVLPDFRRQGLAEILLTDLSNHYIEFFKRILPDEPLSNLYFASAVESFNDSSANLFKKTGWTQFGLGTTWIYCTTKGQ